MLSFNDGHGNDCIELIKSITDKKIEFWFCLTNGSRYEVFDGIIPYTNLVSREDALPATKEQRNQLEKAMADAGYKWNPDEKKMEKIEQNPAWSEEDEEALEVAIIALEDMYSEDSPLDCYAGHHMPFDKAANQLKSIKERVIPQPKQEWSEEDENILEEIKRCVGIQYPLGNPCIFKFLKSLKDKVQPKVELTQLDKNILEATIAFVKQNNHFNCWGGVDKHTVLSALHSLRPQNTWKPSEEQMEALEKECFAHSNYDLCRLLEDLKKLKG